MTDDLFAILQHEGYLSLYFDGSVRTTIKTGNPRSVQGAMSDQVGANSTHLGVRVDIRNES